MSSSWSLGAVCVAQCYAVQKMIVIFAELNAERAWVSRDQMRGVWLGREPSLTPNSCESVCIAVRPPLCGHPQSKGAELLLGLMDYLFIDELFLLSAVHEGFYPLLFKYFSDSYTHGSTSVLVMSTELCPALNSLLRREKAAQLHSLGGESKTGVPTIPIILIQ